MENISIEGGGVSAFPVNMAQDGRNSTDNELDIICLIQERDAYKLETDKLRKIIDRQRFIIQSLQEQIARKQGASPASTPVVEDPEMLPASSGYHGVSPNNPFSAAMSRADAPNNNVKIDPDSAANATSNSLGLSALSTTVQPKSSPAIRKISQGAATASPPLQPDNRDSVEVPSSQVNARPWAKSTRLSEIYADYSARHNSVSPMFKSSATSSTGLGGNDGDKTYRVPSSGGSSFVESLKSSIQRTEWPNELGSPGGLGYGSDNSPGGRRISSLVLDPSRDRSHSLETEGAQKLRSSSAWSTKSVADGPDGDFVHISNMPAETTKGTTPQITKQPSNVSARSVGDDAHYSSRDIADPSNAANPSKSAMAEPVDTLQSPVSAKSAAQTAQELVMRPISIFANRADSTLHSEKSVKEDEAQMQKDGNWRASQISQYEYGDLFDKQPVQVPTDVISSQQQLQQRQQQQQQTNKASYANNSSFGPAADAEHKVKWAMDNGSSSKNAGPELVVSTTFSDATRPLPGTRLQGSKELQGIPEDEEVQSSAQNDAELLFKSPNSGSSVHYESSVTSMPQSITPSHSYASTSKYEAQPGATQLSSLQDIDIWIKDSRVKIDERGKEVNVYMVDIVRRKEISGMSLQEILIESQQSSIVLWTVEKRYSDFLNLNTKLRQVISKERISDKLEKLPDKDIFRPNAPTKSDKRKVWFEKYLKKALVLQILDKQPLIEFLSTDRTMEPEKKMPILLGHKEGFLVKKGKNFGGWKRRYYTCKSNKPLLEYFESPGGSVIGSINLSGAVVKMGKTRENEVPTSRSKGGQKGTDMFRHAFLIEEQPKRAGKDPISHPLWADSDRERDEWVMALRYVIVLDSDGPERAMRDVVKYLNYTNNKDPNMLMLHQIHTSITHEQGARRSIEYSRRKEEQRISSASVDSSDGRSFEMRRPSYAQPSGSSGNGNSNSGNSKFGSPLSRQMWPVAASMDNLGYTGRSAGKLEMKMLAEAEPKQKPTRPPGVPDPIQEQVDHRPSQERNRHRSISYPSSPVTEAELPDSQRRDTGINKTRTSPTVIAATLSTSFSGCNDDSLSTQADRISVHYVPSEISTIESSLYSSYNGAENSRRANGVSSRSVDEHNSYASLPESPVSPRKLAEAEPMPTERAREKGASNHTALQQEQKGKGHTLVHAESTPQLQTHGSTAANPSAFGDAGLQMAQAVAGMSRSQFTKNSLGRIVHEEDYAPELPSNTPRVTDDILGVGRQESPSPNSAARNASNGEGHTRTREEKKRGRITFMWGKRKPVESEAPALPDNPI
ncbi:Rho GTPase activating protein, partial [Coemansia sp. RSA 1933]